MATVFSGIQPSGELHLGNYLGAIRHWVADQHAHSAYYCLVDLHALTLEHDPALLASRTLELATLLVSVGLDPDECTLFVQSHVPEHTELAWLLECTATMGQLRRMTQFKEKGGGQESVKVGLFAYPVLQAADILLYNADRVPVGDDQRQHLELARDVATRFNHNYGQVFVVPEAAVPATGARIMDLQQPDKKMSKSLESPQGTILLTDSPEEVERKIRRAVTDPGTEVRYEPATKPGVSNLLELLGASTGAKPAELASSYDRYGPLKEDTASAVVELLAPIQRRYAELSESPSDVEAILEKGAAKAREVASGTYARARDAIGLMPRS